MPSENVYKFDKGALTVQALADILAHELSLGGDPSIKVVVYFNGEVKQVKFNREDFIQ